MKTTYFSKTSFGKMNLVVGLENIFKHLRHMKGMKRRGMPVAILFVLLTMTVAVSADDFIDETNKAFMCLDNRVGETTLSLEEAVFAGLAKVPSTKVNSTITSQKSATESCWPSTGCTVKSTAQVALAKKANGENVSSITTWLGSRAGSTDDLTWYLQIIVDNNGPASCLINYNDADHSVSINENMRLSGSPGSCLEFAKNNNWLRIKSTCLDEGFSVQCDSAFKTNLLYEKAGSGATFVSPDTHGAAAGAWTVEQIKAKCFKENGECNYEGSLWATTALYADGKDIAEYAPYLRAFASENEEYFPSAFLIALLQGRSEHYSKIAENQRVRPEGSYWEAPNSAYNKFYDTALAMLAYGGAKSSEVQNARSIEYLFDIQDANGCWNGGNIRDTAFIIYSAKWLRTSVCGSTSLGFCTTEGQCTGAGGYWYNSTCHAQPEGVICGDGVKNSTEICDCGSDGICTNDELGGKSCTTEGYDGGNLTCANDCTRFSFSQCIGDGPPPITNNTNGTGPYNPEGLTDCELEGLFCVPSRSSCLGAGGNFFPQETHSCANFLEYCCTVDVAQETCSALGGRVCAYNEVCTGSVKQGSDGVCCMDTCEITSGATCTSDSDCAAGNICLSGGCVNSGGGDSCLSDDDCLSGEVCESGSCVISEGPNWKLLIVLLGILILLVVLGIIFRNKIRVALFKLRGKAKTSKVPPSSGFSSMRPMERRLPPSFGMQPHRPPQPSQVRPVQTTAPKQPEKPTKGDKSKDEDDVFKKLREMGK